MTVARTPVQLFVERAPTDPFDDDSTPRYRVVAALGQGAARRHVVPLTRAHDTEAEAMAVLSDKILRAVSAGEAWAYARDEADRHVANLHRDVPGEPCTLTFGDALPAEPAGRKRWRK